MIGAFAVGFVSATGAAYRWIIDKLNENQRRTDEEFKRQEARNERLEDELRKLKDQHIEIDRRRAWKRLFDVLSDYLLLVKAAWIAFDCEARGRVASDDVTFEDRAEAVYRGLREVDRTLMKVLPFVDDDGLLDLIRGLATKTMSAVTGLQMDRIRLVAGDEDAGAAIDASMRYLVEQTPKESGLLAVRLREHFGTAPAGTAERFARILIAEDVAGTSGASGAGA